MRDAGHTVKTVRVFAKVAPRYFTRTDVFACFELPPPRAAERRRTPGASLGPARGAARRRAAMGRENRN